MNQPRINENRNVRQKRASEKAKRVTVSRTRLPEINISPQRKAGPRREKKSIVPFAVYYEPTFRKKKGNGSPNDSIRFVVSA